VTETESRVKIVCRCWSAGVELMLVTFDG